MNQDLMISGFSDEISSDFDTQLEVVSKLGMHYISLRGIDGKNIGDFSVEEVKETCPTASAKVECWCFFDWLANWQSVYQ